MFLFLHEIVHILTGFIIGIIFYKRFKDIKLFISAVSVSLLLDLDHYIDLFLYTLRQNIVITPLMIFTENYFAKSEKVYVIFHSYEIVILLLLLSLFRNKIKKYLLLLASSVLIHILIDQLTYRPFILEYFFVYRLINGFSLSAFR